MPTLQVVSRERFADKRWKRYSSYSFAATETIAGLVLQELPRACLTLPIAFVQVGEGFTPVAVQGLRNGQNLFVAPDGRWLAEYTPAAYRGYPFALAKTEDGQEVLCFDEDSQLLSDSEGEPFFADDNQPTEDIKKILNFLAQVSANRKQTQAVCAVLQKHNIIQPWPIQIKMDQGHQTVEGLYRIDEAALNGLPVEALDEVRRGGGLPVAYCQLLSMQHLQKLGQLAEAHAKAHASAQEAQATLAPEGELDLEFLNDGDTIKFS